MVCHSAFRPTWFRLTDDATPFVPRQCLDVVHLDVVVVYRDGNWD